MSNKKYSDVEIRLALLGDAKRDKEIFELDIDSLPEIPGILRWTLEVSQLLFNDCDIQSSDFILLGKTIKDIFKEAYPAFKLEGAYDHITTFSPSDLDILFLMEGKKPQFYLNAISKLKTTFPRFRHSHIPAYIALAKGHVYMALWLSDNCPSKFKSIEAGLKSYLKYDRVSHDRKSLVFFPDKPGYLHFFLEAIASSHVALHGQVIRNNNSGNSDENLDLIALINENRLLEENIEELQKKMEDKRIIASETGRQAVLEGKWNPRDKKFTALKPEIDKLAAENKKHHEIAEKLIKRVDENKNPLCSYKTSKGLNQEIKFGELKDLIKSYFVQTNREYLIHGRQNTR